METVDQLTYCTCQPSPHAYSVHDFSKSVMVSVDTWNYRTMFIEPGVKINGAYYRDVLLGQHLCRIRSVAGDFFTFQQDNASAHHAGDTVEFLSRNTPDLISPLLWPLWPKSRGPWTMRCGACSSIASTVAGFATSTTWNSVSSRSGVALTRTSLTKQFDSGVFDYVHVSVQMAATLSTNCNWCYCVRTAKATFPYGKLLCFWVPFLNSCCSEAVRWILLKFAKFVPERRAAKRIFNSDKICRSYCDFYFGVTFLEHSVLPSTAIYRRSENATLIKLKCR